VRFLRRVRDGEDPGRVFCEGQRLVEELLKSGWPPQELYCAADQLDRVKEMLDRFSKPGVPVRVMTDPVMSFVSSVDTPPGVIAIAKKRPSSLVRTAAAPLILVLNGLQLPQNVGAIFRTAEAAGVSEIWTTRGTADPFGPRALRGSSGSVFRIPVCPAGTLKEAAGVIASSGAALVGATQNGRVDYDRIDWTRPTALVLGSEGGGFSDEDAALFSETAKIPMAGSVESLNVAGAAAVCLFEAARQRRAAAR
ncbi:MAG: RNA methyltransferase, partial [Elusimicrobia bacterium]|nr:RNA methyltransferase [Elusimicrobiota bacterium]